ncbi:glutathione S-transferase 1-1-like [Macrosteles quadrilineatus]|uniref:glutathione S-transferase 1-1-like n=1 Tax=Macrosteles quadrilineatus TaxID=74068 RepID=UPI0023E31203|nr:glutathione S-transferase 1-1-like [Macrosteles quadrilineatus]XP_054267990.1 glutathione S-transferase 1-1-like [Macrosteles quadrilineatus]
MTTPIKVYYAPASPPSRVVLMTAKALGVPVEPRIVDLAKGEHMEPQYLQINPQHTVPAIVDNDITLNESRAIITYLADKYGKDDSLYPRCIKKRAVVNQRLYFDAGTLFQRFADYYYPNFFAGVPFDEEKKKKLDEAFSFLDQFLEKTRWVAGDDITIADIAIAVTVSTAEVVGYEVSKYPNVAAWLAKSKTTLPGYEVNQQGVEAFKGMVDFLTSKK